MPQFVYNAVDILFGGGLAEDMSDWMTSLFSALTSIINGSLISTAMNIFSAIACSLLILYFFMDLVDQAKRDMFSFEKLIVGFIKFLAAFAVLLCLPDILSGLVQIGEALYNLMQETGSGTISSAITSGSSGSIRLFTDIPLSSSGRSAWTQMPDWSESAVQEAFEDAFGFGPVKLIKNIQLLIICFIVWIIGMIAKIAGYFICTANALMIIVRIVFSPVAVVQLFEDGSRSSGMRYIKGLAADCITMAVIVVILIVSSALTNGLVSSFTSITEITCSDLTSVLTLKNVAIVLVPELVAVGAMASGSKVAHDVMGA